MKITKFKKDIANQEALMDSMIKRVESKLKILQDEANDRSFRSKYPTTTAVAETTGTIVLGFLRTIVVVATFNHVWTV